MKGRLCVTVELFASLRGKTNHKTFMRPSPKGLGLIGSVLSSPTDNSIPKEGVLTVVDKESENIELTKGSSLENLYEILKEKYPSAFRVPMNEYVFVVNGKKQDPKRTLLLCDKDNVSVFPLVGGG